MTEQVETNKGLMRLCMENLFDSSNVIIIILFLYLLTYIFGVLILEDNKKEGSITPFNQLFSGATDDIISSVLGSINEKNTNLLKQIKEVEELNAMRDGLTEQNLKHIDLTKRNIATNTDSIFTNFDNQINALYSIKSNLKNLFNVSKILLMTIGKNMKLSTYLLSSFIETLNKPIHSIRKIPAINPPLIPNPIKSST